MMTSTGGAERKKAYIIVIFIQVIYTGNALFSKVAIDKGMNPFVFVAYRQGFATIALAPFTYFIERKKAPLMSLMLLLKIFLVALCGITVSLNLYYVALNYTTATFAAATTNTIPAITFVLAVLFRVESISVRNLPGLAKVLGTVIGIFGAMVFAFVKGPTVKFISWGGSSASSAHDHDISGSSSTGSSSNKSIEEWVKGALMMLLANTAYSLWLILQGPIIKDYPARLCFTTLQCLFSSLQSALLAVIVDRNLVSWSLEWDLKLLSVTYCGIIVTGMTYWLQVWCIEKKGPVFIALFTPLALLLTAVLSAFLWKETLSWGKIGGAILLVAGLYSVLWGKDKEDAKSTSAHNHHLDQQSEQQRHEDNDIIVDVKEEDA